MLHNGSLRDCIRQFTPHVSSTEMQMEGALTMMDSSKSEQVVNYIRSLLRGFVIYTQIDANYGHVGAILADAVLQSNNNYERNVRPRIARIRKLYAH